MRLKFITILASVGLMGAAVSGCVSEEGSYHSEYRPAPVHHTYRSRAVYRVHERDRSHHRYGRHDDHDRGREHHSSRDHHDRCRPGDKRCDRRHM